MKTARLALSRSEQMARIRAKNTRPEILLRKALWAAGIRYRLHAQTPFGRPDIVLRPLRVAIFVDGCFWHGCPSHYARPRTRTSFWAQKLMANFERDQRQTFQLEAAGWRVFRVWEHDVRHSLSFVVTEIVEFISKGRRRTEFDWRVVEAKSVEPAKDAERWTLRRLREPSQTRVETRRRTGR